MLTDLVVSQKVVKVNEFTVVGVPIRTDEPVEETGTGLIPEHWQTFYKQQLANKIANKVNGNTFALYTEFEYDQKMDFTFALGYEVLPGGELKDDMREFTIPEGEYMVFTTAVGPARQVVVEAWAYIREWAKKNHRAYKIDFELYDERCIDPEYSQVDIYVSI
ncbi:GyrI-like domain-containing protein [Priestia megaterium]|uniref:GyrI-like domain-containing protein n=1 Tax=Priestia megaterium TaxID=1404 RepID=UPI0011A22702|nr:GyrI-like domain-containing protein [Priestia megaterium]MCM3020039.1 GyrI-like domain-containing protein [Priestia megaterium]